MIGRMLAGSWFECVVISSFLLLTVGLLLSWCLQRRSARAYHILWLCMLAAVLFPGVYQTVKRLQWGLGGTHTTWPRVKLVRPEMEGLPATAAKPDAMPNAESLEKERIPNLPNQTPSFYFLARTLMPGAWLFISLGLLIRLAWAWLASTTV